MRQPLNDFRIKDVWKWHIVEAYCPTCNRTVEIPHLILKRGRKEHDRLVDLERNLRCTNCGVKGRSYFKLRKQPR